MAQRAKCLLHKYETLEFGTLTHRSQAQWHRSAVPVLELTDQDASRCNQIAKLVSSRFSEALS